MSQNLRIFCPLLGTVHYWELLLNRNGWEAGFCPLLGAFPLLGSALLGEYSVLNSWAFSLWLNFEFFPLYGWLTWCLSVFAILFQTAVLTMGYLLPVSDWMEPGSGSEVRLTAGETAAMGVARSSITRSLGLEVPDLKGTERGLFSTINH